MHDTDSAIVPAGPLATRFAQCRPCRERVFKKINWETAISPSTGMAVTYMQCIYYGKHLVLTVYTVCDLLGYRSFHFAKYIA